MEEFGDQFTVSVDTEVILFSLGMAIIHVIFEGINLYLESNTAGTNFSEYMVACYSARQGWIP